MYNQLIIGTKRKAPDTNVDEEQQDTTRIAGRVNETENETETDTMPATSTEYATGTADTIVADGTMRSSKWMEIYPKSKFSSNLTTRLHLFED